MAWVRFDDGFFRHPKVVTAGRDARDLYMASVFYANSNLTDGYIPEGALRLIAADAGINSHARAVKSLIEVRLWVVDDGGFRIHDYLKYQASAESVTSSREANAKRQEEYRNRKRNAASNGKSNAVTNAPVTDPPINIPNPIAPSEQSDSDESLERASDDAHSPAEPKATKFTEFWQAYPKKVGKGAAAKAFKGIKWREVDFASLMAALDRQKRSAQWQEEGGRFIPNPATWLNQERWGDELSTTPSTPAGEMTTAQRLAEQARRERAEYEQARSDRGAGDIGDSLARETDNRRDGPGLFLVAGRRTV